MLKNRLRVRSLCVNATDPVAQTLARTAPVFNRTQQSVRIKPHGAKRLPELVSDEAGNLPDNARFLQRVHLFAQHRCAALERALLRHGRFELGRPALDEHFASPAMRGKPEENEKRGNDRAFVLFPDAHEAPLAQERVGSELKRSIKIVDSAEIRADCPVKPRHRRRCGKYGCCCSRGIVRCNRTRNDEHPARVEIR